MTELFIDVFLGSRLIYRVEMPPHIPDESCPFEERVMESEEYVKRMVKDFRVNKIKKMFGSEQFTLAVVLGSKMNGKETPSKKFIRDVPRVIYEPA